MDHAGPLESTAKSYYKHLLVIVEAFTEFVWIFPVKSTGTAKILSKLRIVREVFRNPKRIITDRGTAYTSN